MTWLFIDEREDSINDGEMIVSTNPVIRTRLSGDGRLPPRVIHGAAGGFGFADGHSEVKKWKDARTMPVVRKSLDLPFNVPSPNNRDVLWMMERCTRKVK